MPRPGSHNRLFVIDDFSDEEDGPVGQENQPPVAGINTAAGSLLAPLLSDSAQATPEQAVSGSSGGSSGLVRAAEAELAGLRHYRDRVGPQLRQLRTEQRGKEYYTLEHLHRVRQYESGTPWQGVKGGYCKDLHAQPCHACISCHFCRQKTVCARTECACAYSRKAQIAGKGRGYWCGSCLWARMGQNLDDIRRLPAGEWRCPCCQDTCNCSSANCLRNRRGLRATAQLVHEANSLGFKSVAHYLVLTHLSSRVHAMPMEDVSRMAANAVANRKRSAPTILPENLIFKVARLGHEHAADKQQRSKQKRADAERQRLGELKRAFPLPQSLLGPQAGADVAAQLAGWSVLDDDEADDDQDDESGLLLPGPASGSRPSGTAAVPPRTAHAAAVSHDHSGASTLAAAGYTSRPAFTPVPDQTSDPQSTSAEHHAHAHPLEAPAAGRDARAHAHDYEYEDDGGPHDGLGTGEGGSRGRRQIHVAQPQSTWQSHGRHVTNTASSSHAFASTVSEEGTAGMRQAGYADSPAEDQIDAPAALQPHTSSRPHSSAQACQQSGSNSFPPDPGVAAPDEQAAEATALQQQAACRHDPAASGIQSAMGHQPGAARPAAQEPGGSQQLPAVLETDPQRWSVSGILGHRAKLLAQLPVHSPDYEVCWDDMMELLSDFDSSMTTSVAVSSLNADTQPKGAISDDREAAALLRPPSTHAHAAAAIDALIACAAVLPAADLDFYVCRRLLNQEHFIDFARSDPLARAYLLQGAFALLQCMTQRGLEAASVIEGITCFLDVTALEYERLFLRGVKQGINLGEDFCEGPIKRGKLQDGAGLQSLSDAIHLVMQENLELLKTGLAHLAACLSQQPCRAPQLLGAPLLQLLSLHRPHVRSEVRRWVFKAVQNTVAAAVAQMPEASQEAQGQQQRQLATWLLHEVVPRLEDLVAVSYPLRRPQSSDASQLAPTEEQPHADLLGKGMVAVLGQIQGYLVAIGLQNWQAVHSCAFRPHTAAGLHRHATLSYRRFAMCLISNALQVAPDMAQVPEGAARLLRLWLLALFDDGGRASLTFFTKVLMSNPHLSSVFTEANAATLGSLRADRSGSARGALAQSVLAAAGAVTQDVVSGLEEIIVLREREVAERPNVHAWECAAATVLLHVLSADSARQAFAASGGAQLLKQLALMMQRCSHRIQHACHAAAEAAAPATRSMSLADARSAVRGSALGHMSAMFRLLTGSSGAAAVKQPALLEPLRIALAACLEGQAAAVLRSPAETALHELLADALLPQAGPAHGQGLDLLLMVLGTFVRRWLERSCAGHVAAERTAVSVVRWLSTLLLSTPALQPLLAADDAVMRQLLPALLVPLLDVLQPLGSARPSAAVKHAVQCFTMDLFTRYPGLIPAAAPLPAELPTFPDTIAFRSGPLQTGQPVSPGRYQAALHAFHWAACADALSCIAALVLPHGSPAPAPPSQSRQLVLQPLDQQELQHARSLLFHALGQPRSTDAVQRLYASAAPVQSSAAAMPSAEFRPGDFPWRLAESSMQVFESLAANGNAGLAWSMAGATCLASLMRCSPAHSSPLRDALSSLMQTLSSHGQNVAGLQLHRTPAAPLQAVHRPPAPQAVRAPAQSQARTPLSAVSAAGNEPTASFSQTATSIPATQDCATQPQAQNTAEAIRQADRRLSELGSVNRGDTVALTAWLQHRPRLKLMRSANRQVATAVLADGGCTAKLLWVCDDCRQMSMAQDAWSPEAVLVVALTGLVVISHAGQSLHLKATPMTVIIPQPPSRAGQAVQQFAAAQIVPGSQQQPESP